MKLYLIRHGEAIPEENNPERPLSEKGMLDVSEIAAFLECAETRVDEIWYSTKLRAKQTAKIIAEAVPHKNLVERERINPNDPVKNIADEIGLIHEDIIIVGHLPFLDKLISQLLTKQDCFNIVDFETAGLVCLEKWEGGWAINWTILPDLLTSCIRHKNR